MACACFYIEGQALDSSDTHHFYQVIAICKNIFTPDQIQTTAQIYAQCCNWWQMAYFGIEPWITMRDRHWTHQTLIIFIKIWEIIITKTKRSSSILVVGHWNALTVLLQAPAATFLLWKYTMLTLNWNWQAHIKLKMLVSYQNET